MTVRGGKSAVRFELANGSLARQALACSMALAVTPLASMPALAQDAAGAPRERTGPLAQPLAQPEFAKPAPEFSVAEPEPYVAPTRPATVTFQTVNVLLEGEGTAVPQSGWLPGKDDATGLSLSAPGPSGFDGQWVEQQFRANGLVGQPTSYSRILGMVQLVNRAFLANGYANSGVLVAAQEPGSDSLNLRLINGRVIPDGADGGLNVRFAGDRSCGLSQRYVAQRMPSARSVPFNSYLLERDFRLLAADPAVRNIDASLRPGARHGEAALDILVTPECQADVYALVANDRSPAIGSLRAAVGGSLRNTLVAGDLVSAEASYAEGLTDGYLSYAGPVFGPRTRLLLRGAINDAAVVERRFEALDIKSKEWSVEGGVSHTLLDTPLIPDDGRWRAARSLSVGMLVAHRKTETELLGEPFSFSPGSVDGRAEYTALRLTQDFVERGTRHVLAVSLTETIGLDGTNPTAPGAQRVKKNFTAILGQVSFAYRLTEALDANLRVGGQYSGGIVYSGERFSIGGQNSVRGYRENLLLADRALFASVELGYNFTLTGDVKDVKDFDWGAFRISAFVDGAVTGNARPPDPLPKSVASVGASLTWRPSDAISARITYGEALRDVSFVGKRHLQDKGISFRVTIHPTRLF
ncbi:MAG: ShlB/FhaC/HecB family hemolysin secretion/activation protein [Novosphingobium sp.]|nr:ShlB/FhaC/HecB family hemolysin secretion/activation protein [Novosphingobium sp.]